MNVPDTTVIVDYGVGNVGAVANMVRRLGGCPVITRERGVIRDATRLILPGVGAFDAAMGQLTGSGVIGALTEAVHQKRVPLLGICVGMQVLARGSEEGGSCGLGWLDAEVVRFKQTPAETVMRVPQMGWNTLTAVTADPLLRDFADEPCYLYFLHSFHVVCDRLEDVIAWTRYGYEFPSMVRVGNVWGVQGHPEKSHRYGMAILGRFLEEGGQCSGRG